MRLDMPAKMTRPGGRKRRAPGRPSADTQAALSKELIVAKGLELCRGIPLQDLSIVRMARELGVTPALIHYYLGGREALTSGVMNAYYRELVEALPGRTGDWQGDVAAVLRTIYEKDVKYGGIVAYVMSHNRYRLFQDVEQGETDYGVVFFDRLAACVRQAGLDPSSSSMFVHLLLQHVLASAYQHTSHQLPGDHHAFLLSRLGRVDARERPDLHFMLEAFSSLDGAAAFEAGLALLIDGMAAARVPLRQKKTARR
jgi:AcrR family transcriptional regulator